jgi:hypothetical protein
MAFYAEVYGYILKKDEAAIPACVLESARAAAPIFKPCFSSPVQSKGFFHISFACRLKIDDGEDVLWLSPFEAVLRKIDFVWAVVIFDHEETPHSMSYSYLKNVQIEKLTTRLNAQTIGRTVLSG